MRTYARHALAAGAAGLLMALLGTATAHADTTPQPPKSIMVTLTFHGEAAGKTKTDAEAAAKAAAAMNEKQFTDQSKATCTDKSSKVDSQMIGEGQFLAFAEVMADCAIPVPAPPAG
jgi:hypothetical protein